MIPNRRRGRGDGPGLWPVVKSALPPALWPAIGFLAVLYVLPLGQVLPLSVVEPTPGIDNYVRLATTPLYALVLENTFEISLVVAAICLVLGYPTAYLLATCRPQARSILLVFVMVPFFTSILVRTYSWIFILGWKGIINTTLLAGGVIDEPLELLYNRFGVIVGMVHVLLPYMILILFSVMRGIDRRLVAAAASLSAAPFTAFRRVYLPLSLPGIGSGFLLVLVLALAFFITPAMLGGPKDLMIANVIAYQIGVLKWGFASALAVVLLVVSIAFLVVTQWFFGGVSAITGGGGSAMTWRRSKVREGPVTQCLDRLLEPVWRHVPAVLGGLVLAFLIVPVFVMVPLSLNPLTYFVFPPEGISFRWYAAYLGNRDWLEATWNSLQIGLMTVAGTMALAVPASLGIARSSSRLTMAAYAFIVSPMIVPAIITAIAIFFLMSKVGLVGTTVGVTLGHMVGAFAPGYRGVDLGTAQLRPQPGAGLPEPGGRPGANDLADRASDRWCGGMDKRVLRLSAFLRRAHRRALRQRDPRPHPAQEDVGQPAGDRADDRRRVGRSWCCSRSSSSSRSTFCGSRRIAARPGGLMESADVLVTGGTGFVGVYVVRDLLAAGRRVAGVRPPTRSRPARPRRGRECPQTRRGHRG